MVIVSVGVVTFWAVWAIWFGATRIATPRLRSRLVGVALVSVGAVSLWYGCYLLKVAISN